MTGESTGRKKGARNCGGCISVPSAALLPYVELLCIPPPSCALGLWKIVFEGFSFLLKSEYRSQKMVKSTPPVESPEPEKGAEYRFLSIKKER
jgi:hypothetical protein